MLVLKAKIRMQKHTDIYLEDEVFPTYYILHDSTTASRYVSFEGLLFEVILPISLYKFLVRCINKDNNRVFNCQFSPTPDRHYLYG